MDFNKSTCVALKSTYEALKIYVPGAKDYVRGRRKTTAGSYFFSHRKTMFPLLDKKNPRAEVRGSRYHR